MTEPTQQTMIRIRCTRPGEYRVRDQDAGVTYVFEPYARDQRDNLMSVDDWESLRDRCLSTLMKQARAAGRPQPLQRLGGVSHGEKVVPVKRLTTHFNVSQQAPVTDSEALAANLDLKKKNEALLARLDAIEAAQIEATATPVATDDAVHEAIVDLSDPVNTIRSALPDLTAEALTQLRLDEKAGEARQSLLSFIDRELRKR